LCISLFAFGPEDASRYHEAIDQTPALSYGKIFEYPATWLSALYLFAYVGLETAISGWIVSFMLRYRGVTPYLASMASTAFWGGMTVSRFSLGAVTDNLGVGRANSLYFLITIACQFIFACVSGPITSVVLMAFVGFFMGPMFASGVVILTRLLPVDLHVAAVSCVASAGQIGAALLPFLIGAFIKGLGIGIFRVAVVALSIMALSVWIPISRQQPAKHRFHDNERRSGDTLHRSHSH
jgi:fucose permease